MVLASAIACVGPDTDGSLERALIEQLEQENAGLRKDLAEANELLRVLSSELGLDVVLGIPSIPAISASVLEVNQELHLVVLDKGARDRVKAGYTFEIYRGQTYKGQVRVQGVQEDRCSALVISERNAMAPGDSATTRL